MKKLSLISATAFVSILVLLAMASSPAAAAPKPGGSASATVALPAPPSSSAFTCDGIATGEVTGLYWDERGLYGSADGLSFNSQTWSFLLAPVCPTKRKPIAREMNLLLPDAASAQFGDAAIPKCGRIWVTVPDLVNANTNDIVGVAAPPGSSTGNTVFVYFVPDTNHDGKFDPQDGVYNVRWQSGIRVVSRTPGPGTGQTTFVLSSQPDLSNTAQLINHSTNQDLGFYCIPLDLTVVVTQ
jgi:hypothetical protein